MAQQPLTRLLAGFYLLLALAQLLLFLPRVSGGRALDFALFRVDALSLAFGVVWTLVGMRNLADEGRRTKDEVDEPELDPNRTFRIPHSAFRIIFTLGLLCMAYAREPLVLLVGWEVAGLALWLPLGKPGQGELWQRALSIHLPGALLLATILLGPAGPFAPPQGGEAGAWPLFVAASLGVVALYRAGCWLFWEQTQASGRRSPLVMLYIVASPFLLAKALVAAPWDDLGMWLLALLGTLGLFVSLLTVLSGVDLDRTAAMASACASAGVAALGLAPASPLAAVGAIALLLAAPFWAIASAWPYRDALYLPALLPGVWLVSQGALDARYRLVAAVVLPVIILLAYKLPSAIPGRSGGRWSVAGRPHSVLITLLFVAVASYPQAAVEWVLRPAVGAMAGGVGFPSALVSNWGLGLTVQSAQEHVLAALPATGIALAIFLAWAALFWLRALMRRITGE